MVEQPFQTAGIHPVGTKCIIMRTSVWGRCNVTRSGSSKRSTTHACSGMGSSSAAVGERILSRGAAPASRRQTRGSHAPAQTWLADGCLDGQTLDGTNPRCSRAHGGKSSAIPTPLQPRVLGEGGQTGVVGGCTIRGYPSRPKCSHPVPGRGTWGLRSPGECDVPTSETECGHRCRCHCSATRGNDRPRCHRPPPRGTEGHRGGNTGQEARAGVRRYREEYHS